MMSKTGSITGDTIYEGAYVCKRSYFSTYRISTSSRRIIAERFCACYRNLECHWEACVHRCCPNSTSASASGQLKCNQFSIWTRTRIIVKCASFICALCLQRNSQLENRSKLSCKSQRCLLNPRKLDSISILLCSDRIFPGRHGEPSEAAVLVSLNDPRHGTFVLELFLKAERLFWEHGFFCEPFS